MKHASFPHAPPPRGTAPVGRMSDLAPPDIAAITYLRMWQAGAAEAVGEDFSLMLGRDGAEAIHAFARLTSSITHLPTHSPGCPALGGAESAFAGLLACAASGDEDAAMTYALHLTSGHPPLQILALAARVGLALAHMARHLAQPSGPRHTPTPTRH
ncbi:MAG: hypothetical protein P1U55_04635 [Vannielia sp.]|nr:hypothetical protein [Vannielia sp.]